MKPRLFIVLLVVIGLLAAMSSATAAQAPSGGDRSGFPPAFAPELTGPNVAPEPPFDPEGGRLWGNPVAGFHAESAAAPDAPAVAIGQPGVVYRYVQTWGDPQEPYFDDPNHFDEPGGLTTDGGNVWIAESVGRRLTKYSAAGTFLTQIGKAGLSHVFPATVAGFTDVAVDSSGNIWATDWASHVLQFNSSGAYVKQLFSDWNGGQGNSQFNTPTGLAFDAVGRLYVSDTYNHRIQVFQPDGTYLATIGVTGQPGADNAHFNEPQHIIIDSNSRLYVADSGNHRVQILDIAGFPTVNFIASIGISGVSGSDNTHLNTPHGVAVDISRGRIYVADAYNWRIQVFDYTTRAWQATLADSSFTEDVAVDASGNLYISKPWGGNHIVKQFNSSLTFVRSYGTEGVPYLTDGLHYYQPSGVAVGTDGSLYISEAHGRRLTKLSSDGAPLWSIGDPGNWGGDNNHFSYARAMDLDSQGRVYVVDEANCRVQVYESDGSYRWTLGKGGDNCGVGNDQFDRPRGVAIGPGDMIYVADSNNHRVQVFDSNRNYVATIGQTGVSGWDNSRFNYPIDVDVDITGYIYVVDQNNHRVQIFNPSRIYVRTIGESGVAGDDFGHLRNPTAVVVGSDGRTFVASSWGDRIHVYDSAGAYLTTIGGSYGERTGQLRDASGLALDTVGNLYVAEAENHRIQKFAPGVPGWRQVNINGFGDRNAGWLSSLLPFQGSLYAAGYPARIWRMTAAGVWSQANTDGFGDNNNREIDALAEFDGQFYAATYNWVCDDANCNTGHSTSPQVWRSADGATWNNVTPVGGFGAGAVWVDAFVIFNNQLYMDIAGDSTRGAQLWRTSDGTSWTRVVENGFGDDVYNYMAPSLAVFNGNLYAGTGHGDWYNDGHPDGPLGGEVWRSSDGTTWTQVNTPGFGTPEAFRVESMQVFQNGLYAYVSHMGGSAAGADVWRCTKVVCSEQGDWTKVMDNGFGVPQIQFLTSGAVSGAYLYASAVTYNLSTGMQLWRTANGTDWEKATPYDGLGNSNNRYAYRSAMIDFNGRLTLGITNYASGAGVWQKTLTADFTATPTRGAPPLTVHFTNTSAGDFTTSQWDFGDGGTSTDTNPTHTYTAPGTYAVTLTVGDGTETSAITKPAYIVAKYFTYLPLVMRNWDPYLYDDFNDTTWDGVYNPAKWQFEGNSAFQIKQQGGALIFTGGSGLPASQGAGLQLRQPGARSLKQLQVFEGKLKIGGDHVGGYTSVELFVDAENIAGHNWWTQCMLGTSGGSQATFYCDVTTDPGGVMAVEYRTSTAAKLDTWHTYRIEINPVTAELRFLLDGTLIGNYVPKDAAALVAANTFRPKVTVWNGNANSYLSRYVDDVRITPAQ